MQEKIRTTTKWLIAIPLCIYLIYCMCFCLIHEARPTYLDSGKIISKSADEVHIKHRSRTNLYLNVQFDRTGFISVLVDPSTYFYHKVGDTIQFNLNRETSVMYSLNHIIGIMSICLILFILFIALLIYLFPFESGVKKY